MWRECGKCLKGSRRFTWTISPQTSLSMSISFHTQYRFYCQTTGRNYCFIGKTSGRHREDIMYFSDNKNCRKNEQKKVESGAFAQVESDGAVIALTGWELFPDSQVPAAPYLFRNQIMQRRRRSWFRILQNQFLFLCIIMNQMSDQYPGNLKSILFRIY